MTLEYDIVSVTEAIEYVWKEGMNGMESPCFGGFCFPSFHDVSRALDRCLIFL